MKTAIGASLPEDLFEDFCHRALSFPKGKSGLIKEALREYFRANPFPRSEPPNPIPPSLPPDPVPEAAT